MAWLENAVSGLSQLPPTIVKALGEDLRTEDSTNRSAWKDLVAEEAAFLEELAGTENVDEASFTARAEVLVNKRKDLIERYRKQMGISQRVYDELDNCLNALDKNINEISTTCKTHIAKEDYSDQQKKKKKGGAGAAEPVLQLPTEQEHVSASEPLYCFCKKIAYGRMVGCDGESCRTEWFHFDCVGINDEPSENWFCPDCLEQQKMN